ncbi:MAG TPA: type IIL restriction-modification enzyme MmeI [Hyphomicrobiaceae bacterium]|nr:type IIL restriction-modification enzyme MmeI [Hyphomicrobiaceae bacterium]
MTVVEDSTQVEAFIERWRTSSGAERANFQPFAGELCDLIGVPRPDPSDGSDASLNPYAFERGVDFKSADGTTTKGRIDLYKKGCFVLEAKQSRMTGGAKALRGQSDLFVPEADPLGSRASNRAWDVLMMNARTQAEGYAKALPASDGWPPFVLVCDVGHCIEVYADFSGQGKNYAQFPDRKGFRIYLDDLHDPAIRDRLRAIWQTPYALDPTRRSAKVTREISARLAQVSKGLEARGHNAEDVALFLMRTLFTMFAEDVRLLPEGCFTGWLDRARQNPEKFKFELAQLWEAMDKGGYATIAEAKVRRFNGSFYKAASVLDLQREEIGELHAAARADWKEVDPAIFE